MVGAPIARGFRQYSAFLAKNCNFFFRAKCVVEEYDHFCQTVDTAEKCVPGEKTKGENIADNGAESANPC